jgi:hypothetical protein
VTRETEFAAYLRADASLPALVPGGIYADRDLTVAGVTDAAQTPAVWAGGSFNACIVIREAAVVPQYRVMDEAEQLVDVAQRLEVYIYALTAVAVVAIAKRVFAITQGHHFDDAYAATFQPGLGLMDAPNLMDVHMQRDDYLLVSLRQPA